MLYSFAAGVHAVLVNKRIVILDTRTDTYSCLMDEGDEALQRLCGDQPLTDEQQQALEELVADGLVTKSEHSGLSLKGPVIPRPARSLLSDSPSQTNLLSVLQAYCGQVSTGVALRRKSINTILGEKRPAVIPTAFEIGDWPSLSKAVWAFQRSERLLSSEQKCLRRSIALRSYLLRKKINSSLVIGVRMRPFSAHAWLQIDDCLINDHLDNVRVYAPILVI